MRRSRDLKPWEGVCVTLIGAADRRGAAQFDGLTVEYLFEE